MSKDSIICANFELHVEAEGRAAFDLAIEIAMLARHQVTHWSVKNDVLTLYPYTNGAAVLTALPFAMDSVQTARFAWDWLQAQPPEVYGSPQDHDGGNERCAWRIEAGILGVALTVTPRWAEYPK